MTLLYIFTLDSHDWFGPFLDDSQAHQFARNRFLSSYQLLLETPEYVASRTQVYGAIHV